MPAAMGKGKKDLKEVALFDPQTMLPNADPDRVKVVKESGGDNTKKQKKTMMY